MSQTDSSIQYKSTSQLTPGEYICQPGEDILLRVVDVRQRGNPLIRRLEGPYAGTTFTATQRFGRRWIVLPKEAATERLLVRLIAVVSQPRADHLSPLAG